MRNIQTLAIFGVLLLAGSSLTTAAQNQQSPTRQGTQQGQLAKQHRVQDANGDGLCDVCKQAVGSGRQNAQGQKAEKGKHWGPGDGTGQKDNPPKDGTGYGANSGNRKGAQDNSGKEDGTAVGRGGQPNSGAQPGMGGSRGRGKGRGRN